MIQGRPCFGKQSSRDCGFGYSLKKVVGAIIDFAFDFYHYVYAPFPILLSGMVRRIM
jgi:hypothetical protein